MEFCEPLPDKCPPHQAEDKAYGEAWRVVEGSQPGAKDFASHAKKGIPKRPTDSECDHASCSLFTSRTTIAGLVTRMPKTRFKDPHIAKLAIPKGAGLSLENNRSHVHFWMFASFDPVAAILATEQP